MELRNYESADLAAVAAYREFVYTICLFVVFILGIGNSLNS